LMFWSDLRILHLYKDGCSARTSASPDLKSSRFKELNLGQ
jgi:hypothetical protein